MGYRGDGSDGQTAEGFPAFFDHVLDLGGEEFRAAVDEDGVFHGMVRTFGGG